MTAKGSGRQGCDAPGCDRPHRVKGWCMIHYHQVRRWGEPIHVGKGRPAVDPLVRLERSFVVDAATGCWLWQGYLNPQGYGYFTSGDGRKMQAHRASYELFNGPIPPGMQLDHVCHSNDLACPGGPLCLHRRCINPSRAHLEPVTVQTNNARAQRNAAARRRAA